MNKKILYKLYNKLLIKISMWGVEFIKYEKNVTPYNMPTYLPNFFLGQVTITVNRVTVGPRRISPLGEMNSCRSIFCQIRGFGRKMGKISIFLNG